MQTQLKQAAYTRDWKLCSAQPPRCKRPAVKQGLIRNKILKKHVKKALFWMSWMWGRHWRRLFYKEVKIWYYTTWFIEFENYKPRPKNCTYLQTSLVAKCFLLFFIIFVWWWDFLKEMVETYSMAPMSSLYSPPFFCLHTYSPWLHDVNWPYNSSIRQTCHHWWLLL